MSFPNAENSSQARQDLSKGIRSGTGGGSFNRTQGLTIHRGTYRRMLFLIIHHLIRGPFLLVRRSVSCQNTPCVPVNIFSLLPFLPRESQVEVKLRLTPVWGLSRSRRGIMTKVAKETDKELLASVVSSIFRTCVYGRQIFCHVLIRY